MNIINGITSQPKQQMTIPLEDGSSAYLYVEYREQQSGWFANVSWGTWLVNGMRLTASPNVLQKWQHVIPFGLALLTQGDVEPLNLMDFADGTVTVYLLNADDVAAVQLNSFAGN